MKTVANQIRDQRFALFLSAAAFVLLFWPPLKELVSFWASDSDFSHGFLIPLISATVLWANRRELGSLQSRPSLLGLAAVALALAVFFAGYLTHTNLIQRVGLWGVLVGCSWALFGWSLLKRKPFPFLYLLLAIPPHYELLSHIRFELKGYATRLAADALSLLGVGAIPQGNILVVGDHRLEVADACSGIRSLMAILATAFLFGYLFRTGLLKGALLVATAVPVTILINVLRILIVSLALVRFDMDLTSGLPHEALGLAVFGFSIVLLYLSWIFYHWLFAWRPAGRP